MTRGELSNQVSHRVTGRLFMGVDRDLHDQLRLGRAQRDMIERAAAQVENQVDNKVSESIEPYLTGSTWR